MAKIEFLRFGSADFLRKLDAVNLRSFLKDYEGFLEKQGIEFLADDTITLEEFEALAELFCAPPANAPIDLLQNLWMLEDLTTRAGYAILTTNHAGVVNEIQKPGESIGDVVMKIFLKYPDVIMTAHSRFCLIDRRQLHCFKADREWKFSKPSADSWKNIQEALSERFRIQFNNPAVRITHFEEKDRISMVIRRGDATEHIGVFDDKNHPETKLIRPLKHDVAYLFPERSEFLCTGRAHGVRESYRDTFSQICFGHSDALQRSHRLNLEPLRTGRDCLNVAELKFKYTATLREIHIRHIINDGITILRYRDVFKILEAHGTGYLADYLILSAEFQLRVGKSSFRLQVNSAKDTIGGDKNDPIASEWLKGCRFLKGDME